MPRCNFIRPPYIPHSSTISFVLNVFQYQTLLLRFVAMPTFYTSEQWRIQDFQDADEERCLPQRKGHQPINLAILLAFEK